MDLFDAINDRRSVKEFSDRAVTREEITRLITVAVQAPNHRMTEPWRFYVLGPEARHAYGAALGARKAKRVEDPDAAEAVINKVAKTHEELPSMLAVSIVLNENPEIQEEDFAATYMAVQNLCLAAQATGLGTHIKSGGVMADPRARAAAGVPDGERIVAIVNVGEPLSVPAAKPRTPGAELTTWLA